MTAPQEQPMDGCIAKFPTILRSECNMSCCPVYNKLPRNTTHLHARIYTRIYKENREQQI